MYKGETAEKQLLPLVQYPPQLRTLKDATQHFFSFLNLI